MSVCLAFFKESHRTGEDTRLRCEGVRFLNEELLRLRQQFYQDVLEIGLVITRNISQGIWSNSETVNTLH